MRKSMDAGHVARKRFFGEIFCVLPVVEVHCRICADRRRCFDKLMPYIFIVTHIYIKSCFALPDIGQEITYYGLENLLLSAGSADCEKEAYRLFIFFSVYSLLAVGFDIRNQLMIDIMSGVKQRIRRHFLAYFLLVHAV